MSDPVACGMAQASAALFGALAFAAAPAPRQTPTLCPACGTDDPEAHGCDDCGQCPCRCHLRCSACFTDIERDDTARRGLCLECQADAAEARAEEF
jgi:hypothetical protein